MFFLLSRDTGLINDENFLLLYPSYISQNLVCRSDAFRTACNSNQTLLKSVDFSNGRVRFIQRDKPENTRRLILIKHILNSNKQL